MNDYTVFQITLLAVLFAADININIFGYQPNAMHLNPLLACERRFKQNPQGPKAILCLATRMH